MMVSAHGYSSQLARKVKMVAVASAGLASGRQSPVARPRAGAVDLHRLVEFARDRLEEAAQQEGVERQRRRRRRRRSGRPASRAGCRYLARMNCGMISIIAGIISPSSSSRNSNSRPGKRKRANAYAIIELSSTRSTVATTATISELQEVAARSCRRSRRAA